MHAEVPQLLCSARHSARSTHKLIAGARRCRFEAQRQSRFG
jgi:hypothetical protein